MNSSVMNLFVYFSCIVCVFSCALVQMFLVLAQYKCQVVVVVVMNILVYVSVKAGLSSFENCLA